MTSSTEKRAHVVLAFDARNAPLDDGEHALAARLVSFATELSGPVMLALPTAQARALASSAPRTLATLQAAYASGQLHPLYVAERDAEGARHTLLRSLYENEECVHGLLGAPRPERRGALLPDDRDRHLIAAVEAYGLDYTLSAAPEPSERDDPEYDFAHRPFRLGERLMALSWSAALSRPRERYESLVRAAVGDAPDDGLLLGLLPLDPATLDQVAAAWVEVRGEELARLWFTALDDFIVVNEVAPPWLPQLDLGDEESEPESLSPAHE